MYHAPVHGLAGLPGQRGRFHRGDLLDLASRSSRLLAVPHEVGAIPVSDNLERLPLRPLEHRRGEPGLELAALDEMGVLGLPDPGDDTSNGS